MATIKGKFLKGIAGEMVYRSYRGKQVVQSRPEIRENKRTAGTVKAARLFGQASSLGAGIRMGLGSIHKKWYDGTMSYRLNAELLRCLYSAKDADTEQLNFTSDCFRNLAGFEFNAKSPLKKYFLKPLTIRVEENRMFVDVPELQIPGDIRLPEERVNCRLLIATTLIDLVNGYYSVAEPQFMVIPGYLKNNRSASHTFAFDLRPGYLYITAISLEFIKDTFTGEDIINQKSFHPAAILHTHLTDGTPSPDSESGWLIFKSTP